jgi:hypothetical protein
MNVVNLLERGPWPILSGAFVGHRGLPDPGVLKGNPLELLCLRVV